MLCYDIINGSCDPIADKNEELKKKVKFLNDQMLVRVSLMLICTFCILFSFRIFAVLNL